MELNFVFKLVKYGQSGIQSSTLVTFHTENGKGQVESVIWNTVLSKTEPLSCIQSLWRIGFYPSSVRPH